MIDENPVTDPITRLPVGQHVLAVSAPRFNFYSETIVIRAGDTLSLAPELTPIGASVPTPTPVTEPPGPATEAPAAPPTARQSARCTPGGGYNRDGSCFDERPKPVTPPYVPIPPTVEGTPRASIMWVKVSTEGRTVDVQRLRPSNDEEFERAVNDFVWILTWHPAVKDGAPVEAWTQMIFPPQPVTQPQ
jgi:hypothetical protein